MKGVGGEPARRAVRAAWLSTLTLIPAFGLSFLVGEGLISLLGYPVGDVQPPLLPALIATIPALMVFALPLWPVGVFARRAAREGSSAGWWAFGLTAVTVTGFMVLNLIGGGG